MLRLVGPQTSTVKSILQIPCLVKIKIKEIDKACGNGSNSRIYRRSNKIYKFKFDFQHFNKVLLKY